MGHLQDTMYRRLKRSHPTEPVPPYFGAANLQLFAHLDAVAQAYHDEEAQKGATYVMGAPGVGKSFVARAIEFPAEDQCKVKLGELFEQETEKLDFEVIQKPDLATLDGSIVFNQLSTIAHPEGFKLDSLLDAAGCKRDGALLPLIIIDDLDELHDDSSIVILREVEKLVSSAEAQAPPFLHVVVFGRPESFAPWLKHASRVAPDELWRFTLAGPIYSTSGDLDFLVRNYYDFAKKGFVPSQAAIDSFIQLVDDHPSLSYSIRKLATANFVIEQSQAMVGSSAESIRTTLYDNLLERNYQTHGRTELYQNSYRYAIEEIAARYLDKVDERGFFAVGFQDTVELIGDNGESLGEVRVRNVLDRSGIAFLDPQDFVSGRYQFDPFWIHAHLVEQRNQRLRPKHAYRTCDSVP